MYPYSQRERQDRLSREEINIFLTYYDLLSIENIIIIVGIPAKRGDARIGIISKNITGIVFPSHYFDGTKNDERLISDVVCEVEQQFPYIRYSYFDHEFCFYGSKAQEEARRSSDEGLIKNYIETWDAVDEFQRLFCEEENLSTGRELFQKWFPMSEVELVEIKTEKSELLIDVEQLLRSKRLLNVEVSREQLDDAIESIRKKLEKFDCKKLGIKQRSQKRASFFKQFGCCLKEVLGRRKGEVYILTKEETAK